MREREKEKSWREKESFDLQVDTLKATTANSAETGRCGLLLFCQTHPLVLN